MALCYRRTNMRSLLYSSGRSFYKFLHSHPDEDEFIFVFGGVGYFVLNTGWENKYIPRFVSVFAVFIVDESSAFDGDHYLFYARVIMPVVHAAGWHKPVRHHLKRGALQLVWRSVYLPLPAPAMGVLCADVFCCSLDDFHTCQYIPT